MNAMRTRTLAVLAALLLAGAASQLASGADFTRAEADFQLGKAGDAAANERAFEQFSALVQGEPGSPLLLAYLGSSHTLKGRDAWMPWSKMRWTERGLDLLDKATGLLTPQHGAIRPRGTPVSVETRLVAIATYLGVPAFFNRFQVAKDLLEETLGDPAFVASPPEVRASIYLLAADAAHRDDAPQREADFLRQALEAEPAGVMAPDARSRLRALQP